MISSRALSTPAETVPSDETAILATPPPKG
mgnify:CR=1 FL=1|jgi:hypothetical protein